MPGHGQARKVIAALRNQPAQPLLLATHDKSNGACLVDIVQRIGSSVAGAYTDDTVVAEPVERLADICHLRERQDFCRAGSNLTDCRPEARRAMTRYDDCVDPGSIRCPQACTQIVRILQPVENEQRKRPTLVVGQPLLYEGAQRRLVKHGAPLNFGNDALMSVFARDLLEPSPISRLHLKASVTCTIEYRLHAGIGRTVFGVDSANLAFL